jgi:hypothetical protein
MSVNRIGQMIVSKKIVSKIIDEIIVDVGFKSHGTADHFVDPVTVQLFTKNADNFPEFS